MAFDFLIEKGLESLSGISSEESQTAAVTEQKKVCADCGTSTTPLWRSGPAGPKSLCNACGIKSRKKRRAVMNVESEKKTKKSSGSGSNSSNVTSNKMKDPLNERLLSIARGVMMQKRWHMYPSRRQIGEVEQAAILLMALSYDSFYD
ncbi:hypothetical protein SAY86_020750 [Trapa natans]|uniref:GATA-type domain-containing protein n=1 Tax=Trapa natans TaxID=22666 RepID=A0AAN7M102_TRANT|nr:hypothetical protein SAY86_020750 [Trapa natans]